MSLVDVVDSDGHVIESGAELERFGWDGRTGGLDSLDRMLARDARTLRGATCPGAQPFAADTRLRDMDCEGIATSINYPTALLLVNQLPSDMANGLARAYNSWAHETFV